MHPSHYRTQAPKPDPNPSPAIAFGLASVPSHLPIRVKYLPYFVIYRQPFIRKAY
jgi:hypothetical protein